MAKEVAVDVGHYAAEPGVISASGGPEFEYNLDLALEVKAELEKLRITVRLIGEKGDYAVLHHRTRDAQGADLFVSIHHDSVKEWLLPRADEFSGFSLFVSRHNPQVEKSLACAVPDGKGPEAIKASSRRATMPIAVLGESRPVRGRGERRALL